MSKKKRFGISAALTRGLSETIHVVEHNAGLFRNVVLPLSRIELDPDNPRKLSLDLSDVRAGLRPDDPQFQRKQEELEKLRELAHTIKTSGVINPIVVYKLGETYRIVAGERRSLASILVGKQEIEARVFNEKPRGFELKLLQWIENTAREDLSLDERLGNVRDILREYQRLQGPVETTATLLKELTGLSLSQATYYLAAMNAPADVQQEISAGTIRNLDKAALLAGIVSPDLRRQAIDACVQGLSLKAIRHLVNQNKMAGRAKEALKSQARGRRSARINMGATVHTSIIKTIIESVMEREEYDKYTEIFSRVNWADLRQTTRAFRKFIEIMETETAV